MNPLVPVASRRNVELKVRLEDLAPARQVAEGLATEYLGVERQVDTYFRCPQGRLKLRERDGRSAQLVWYERPNRADAKTSAYYLLDAPQPAELKAALEAAMGVLVVVDKRREIFLWQNVRIHLDQVVSLGSFLEFEAVLQPAQAESEGQAQLASLCEAFALDRTAWVHCSYSDLLIVER